jgi:TPP-dependent pyruvate/acetoin dehydrogenase alpha subunit
MPTKDKKLPRPRPSEIKSKKPVPTTAAEAALAVSSNGSSPSNQDALRNLYAALLKCRLVAEQVQRGSSHVGTASNAAAARYEIAIGHEAVVVGATADLGAEDSVAASPTNLAALVARGSALADLFAASNGRPSSSIPASKDPIHLGTGVALTHKLEKKRNVVVAFFDPVGDSLESQHEAIKFAGAHKLPILYVIESAGGMSSTKGDPYLEPISYMARECGVPGILVDGSDVVAVWRVAQESIHRARSGSGATVIVCKKVDGRDPLAQMETYLKKRSIWDDDWHKQVAAQIKAELQRAGRAGKTSPVVLKTSPVVL